MSQKLCMVGDKIFSYSYICVTNGLLVGANLTFSSVKHFTKCELYCDAIYVDGNRQINVKEYVRIESVDDRLLYIVDDSKWEECAVITTCDAISVDTEPIACNLHRIAENFKQRSMDPHYSKNIQKQLNRISNYIERELNRETG